MKEPIQITDEMVEKAAIGMVPGWGVASEARRKVRRRRARLALEAALVTEKAPKSLGEIAFDGYFQHLPVARKHWVDQDPAVQHCWDSAAEAVLAARPATPSRKVAIQDIERIVHTSGSLANAAQTSNRSRLHGIVAAVLNSLKIEISE